MEEFTEIFLINSVLNITVIDKVTCYFRTDTNSMKWNLDIAGSITFHAFLKQQIPATQSLWMWKENTFHKIKTATVIYHYRLSISLPWMDISVNQGRRCKGFAVKL